MATLKEFEDRLQALEKDTHPPTKLPVDDVVARLEEVEGLVVQIFNKVDALNKRDEVTFDNHVEQGGTPPFPYSTVLRLDAENAQLRAENKELVRVLELARKALKE